VRLDSEAFPRPGGRCPKRTGAVAGGRPRGDRLPSDHGQRPIKGTKPCDWPANWATFPWSHPTLNVSSLGNMTGLSIAGETKSKDSFAGSRVIDGYSRASTNWMSCSPASSSSSSLLKYYDLVLTRPRTALQPPYYGLTATSDNHLAKGPFPGEKVARSGCGWRSYIEGDVRHRPEMRQTFCPFYFVKIRVICVKILLPLF